MSETPRRALVAKTVLAALHQRGMTVEVLSTLMGLSTDDLRDRLDGHVAFDVDELEAISTALGVSIAALLGDY